MFNRKEYNKKYYQEHRKEIIKKKKEYTQKTEYVLEERDARIFIECLNYCHHRQQIHNKFTGIPSEDIRRLRKEFGIIK